MGIFFSDTDEGSKLDISAAAGGVLELCLIDEMNMWRSVFWSSGLTSYQHAEYLAIGPLGWGG